jgi:hypothetical protein
LGEVQVNRESAALMNRKGLSIFTLVIWVLLIVVLWFAFIGGILNQAGTDAVTNGGLTGIEALFYSNLNLFIIAIPLLFFILAGLYGVSTAR